MLAKVVLAFLCMFYSDAEFYMRATDLSRNKSNLVAVQLRPDLILGFGKDDHKVAAQQAFIV